MKIPKVMSVTAVPIIIEMLRKSYFPGFFNLIISTVLVTIICTFILKVGESSNKNIFLNWAAVLVVDIFILVSAITLYELLFGKIGGMSVVLDVKSIFSTIVFLQIGFIYLASTYSANDVKIRNNFDHNTVKTNEAVKSKLENTKYLSFLLEKSAGYPKKVGQIFYLPAWMMIMGIFAGFSLPSLIWVLMFFLIYIFYAIWLVQKLDRDKLMLRLAHELFLPIASVFSFYCVFVMGTLLLSNLAQNKNSLQLTLSLFLVNDAAFGLVGIVLAALLAGLISFVMTQNKKTRE